MVCPRVGLYDWFSQVSTNAVDILRCGLHELAGIAVVAKVTSTATSSRGCVCKSRRCSPASAGVSMKICVSLFPLPHLSNPVRTNPTAGAAEVEWCFEARYVDAWNRHRWVVTRICRILTWGGKETQRSQIWVESVETRFGHLPDAS